MSSRQYQSETRDSSLTAKYYPKLLPKAASQRGFPKLRPESCSHHRLWVSEVMLGSFGVFLRPALPLGFAAGCDLILGGTATAAGGESS
jgi:hypothetical protein